jgi:hypothetical protein
MFANKFCGFCLVVFCVTGCGSGTGNSALSSLSNNGPTSSRANGTLSGSLFLGRSVADARVTVETLEGTVLASTRTNPSGGFFVDASRFPRNFRVRAALAQDATSFTTEVRDYQGQGRYVVINVPTALVSLYAQRHAGESLPAIEQKVAKVLGLNPDSSLQYGITESGRAPFSHLAFFVDASAAGGWAALSEQLLREIDQATPKTQTVLRAPRYRVRPADLSAPLSGLDPGLLAFESQLQEDAAEEITFAGVAESALGAIGEGLGGTLFDVAVDSLWTWMAGQMGLNFGTTRTLELIQDQLNEIEQEIAGISIQNDNDQYNAMNTTLSDDAASPLDTLNDLLTSASSPYIQAFTATPSVENLTDQPFTPTTQVTNLLSELSKGTATTSLDDIQKAMLGSSSLLVLGLKIFVADTLGLDQPARFAAVPVRSNALLNKGLLTFTLYQGYQILACNFLAEQTHQDPTPAQAITNLVPTLQKAQSLLKQQRMQAPFPMLCDNVVVDLEAGVMWLNEVQAENSYANATIAADNRVVQDVNKIVTYDDWRLPTYHEALFVQMRGRLATIHDTGQYSFNSNDGYGDYGLSSSGLANFFSGVENFKSDGDMWIEDWAQVAGAGTQEFVWVNSNLLEFRLNHKDDNVSDRSSSDLRPYLLCRSIGQPVSPNNRFTQVSNQKYPSVSGDKLVNPAPVDGYPPQLEPRPLLPQEAPGLGVLTNITTNTDTSSSPLGGYTVTFQVARGGSFAAGTNGIIQSNSITARVDTFTLPVNFAQTSPNHALFQVLNVASDNTALEVSNYTFVTNTTTGDNYRSGTFVWHTDDAASVTCNVTLTGYGFDGFNYPAPFVATKPITATSQARTLKSIMIMPRNRLYDNRTGYPVQYRALAYKTDGSVTDITKTVTWRVIDPATEKAVPDTMAYFSLQPNFEGQLYIDTAKNTVGTMRVEAVNSTHPELVVWNDTDESLNDRKVIDATLLETFLTTGP